MKYLPLIAALTCLPASAFAAGHADMTPMTATVNGVDGSAKGTVTVTPTESGAALIQIDLSDLPDGDHGIHVHETGDCSTADFTSAGSHLANGHDHGVMSANGPHPGDIPNITVAEDGTAKMEFFNALLTPELMGDEDGSAFIVHAGIDDYSTQPAGDAGDRIACGVFAAVSAEPFGAATQDSPMNENLDVAAADPAIGEEIYKSVCKDCHGPTAKGMASFPKLADKSADVLVERLLAYRAKERIGSNSPLMWPIAKDLSDVEIASLAAYITTAFK
jgi:Cu-Zn family superoxide dismutase